MMSGLDSTICTGELMLSYIQIVCMYLYIYKYLKILQNFLMLGTLVCTRDMMIQTDSTASLGRMPSMLQCVRILFTSVLQQWCGTQQQDSKSYLWCLICTNKILFVSWWLFNSWIKIIMKYLFLIVGTLQFSQLFCVFSISADLSCSGNQVPFPDYVCQNFEEAFSGSYSWI